MAAAWGPAVGLARRVGMTTGIVLGLLTLCVGLLARSMIDSTVLFLVFTGLAAALLEGIGAATEFEGWCNVYRDLPSAEDIFTGKKAEYPRKPDVLYALISSMVHYASVNTQLTRTELGNACRFAARFPMDFATVLYKDLLELPDYDKKLVMIPEFRSWIERQKRQI